MPAEAEFPRVDGVEHRFVDANGIRIHVAEAGDREAPVVVCLHGWPQHWYEWRHLIPALAPRYRVVCPDLRGLGWSEAPKGGYEKENLTTDVLAALDALGVERFDLVGHDWGGWAGFLICLREPERVRRYLALNIAPPFAPANPRTVVGVWRFWYQVVIGSPVGARVLQGTGALGRAVGSWVGQGAWDEEEAEIFLGRLRDPARARASVSYYRTFQLRELPALAAGRYRGAHLAVPTRILFGTGDRVMTKAHFDGVERHADDLEVEFVDGVGHFIADERPELVAERALALFGPGK